MMEELAILNFLMPLYPNSMSTKSYYRPESHTMETLRLQKIILREKQENY